MSADRLQDIMDWLIDGARSAADPEQVLAELCDRLVALGIPIWRVAVFVRTLHPDVFGRSFIWRLGQGGRSRRSEFHAARHGRISDQPRARRHRNDRDGPAPADAECAAELARAGRAAGRRALPTILHFRWSLPTAPFMSISMQTKELAGFSDDDVGALAKIMPPLARVAEVRSLQRTATTLLNTYVGNRAGARILAGQIRRGHADMLHAASGCLTCAASPPCRTGCRRTSSSTCSIATSTARCRRS